jgi:putative endonuclease
MTDGAYLYIVKCSDGSFYVGTTRATLELRIAQHNAGTFPGYTESRRPVERVYSEWFDRVSDAIEAERKLKGWSRAKKEAFIRGDFHRCNNSPSAGRVLNSALPIPHPEERPRGRVSKDSFGHSWFETALKKRLLTMRIFHCA